MSQVDDYRFEEVKFLRSAREFLFKQISDNERNCVIAFAIIVSFYSTIKLDIYVYKLIVAFLPFIISILGFFRAVFLWRLVGNIEIYLLGVERAMDSNALFYLSFNQEMVKKHGFPVFRVIQIGFWGVLIALGFAFGMLGLLIKV